MNIFRIGFEKLVSLKNSFLRVSLAKKLAIVASIVGIGWLAASRLSGNQAPELEYQTALAEKGTLITSISASGTVSSGSSASITSSATGIVQEVYVQNDDIVSEGDKIAFVKLDKSSQQQQTQAWASYLSAQNNLNTAKSKMNSLQAALFTANREFTDGAGTDDPDTDDPQYIIEHANWLQAEANYTQQANIIRQAEVALASSWLSYSQLSSTITAPMSGVVSNLSIIPGMVIASQNSSSSTTDSNTSSLGTITLQGGTPQASVNLTEIDVVNVKPGQKVTLTLDALPDMSFTGKVSAVNTNGSVSSGVTTYPTTITFDTAVDTMYPNMAVNATIITEVKSNVILVPAAAIQTSNGASTVRVMSNDQPMSVQVEIGDANDTQTEIVSGINEGDAVVIGQTGAATSGSTGATSPFGNTRSGFGGAGGPGGGGQMFIQRR